MPHPLSSLIRYFFWALGGFCILLCGSVMVLKTSPKLQKDLAIKVLSAFTDECDLESIELNWNAIGLKNLSLEVPEGRVVAQSFFAKASLIDWLFFDAIDVEEIRGEGLNIDLNALPKDPKSPTSSSKSTKLSLPKLTLQKLSLEGDVTYNKDTHVQFNLKGQGIAPDATGEIHFQTRCSSPKVPALELDMHATLKQVQNTWTVELSPSMKASLDDDRLTAQFKTFFLKGDTTIELSSKSAALKAFAFELADARRNPILNIKVLQGLNYPFKATLDDLFQAQGALLEIQGQRFPLAIANPWTKPYSLNGALEPFKIVLSATGRAFRVDTAIAPNLTDFILSHPDLPALPLLNATLNLSLSTEPTIKKKLAIESLTLHQLGIELSENSTPILKTNLLQPMHLPFDDPFSGLLKHQGGLLSMELTRFPLDWLTPFVQPIQIKGFASGLKGQLSLENQAFQWKSESRLELKGVDCSQNGTYWVKDLNGWIQPEFEATIDSLKASISDFALSTAANPPWATGNCSGLWTTKGKSYELEASGRLKVDLPLLATQPLLPNLNRLQSGEAMLTFGAHQLPKEDVNFNAEVALQQLALKANGPQNPSFPQSLNLTTKGTQSAKSTFKGTGTLSLKNALRETKINGNAELSGQQAQIILTSPLIDLDAALALSELFANDAPPSVAAAPKAPSTTKDKASFWHHLPTLILKADVDEVSFQGSPMVKTLKARARVEPTIMELEALTGTVFDAPLNTTAKLTFAEQKPKPYTLESQLSLNRLNMAKAFARFQPNTPSPIEGLFDTQAEVQSMGMNQEELISQVQGNLTIQGQKGRFYLLEAGGTKAQMGALALGATNLLLGNALPTSLQAAQDLVQMLKVVDFDTFLLQAERSQKLDLLLKAFQVQGPTLLLQAKGAVTHQPKVPLLEQPLNVKATLSAAGQSAILMDRLRLLDKNGPDAQGYRKGPSFEVRGSLAKPDYSDLYKLVMQAGKNLSSTEKTAPSTPQSKTEKTIEAVGSVLKGLIGK
jgi:hypothetical protein